MKHLPNMLLIWKNLSIDQNRVVLKDNKRDRIAEGMLKEGELQCHNWLVNYVLKHYLNNGERGEFGRALFGVFIFGALDWF